MCEARKHEEATCQKLIDALVSKNGRCNYHEDITTGMAELKGIIKALMWLLIPVFTAFIGLQSATLWKLYDHAKNSSAHHSEANHVIINGSTETPSDKSR